MLQGSLELEAISHDKLYTLMQKSHQDKWISSEMKFQDVFSSEMKFQDVFPEKEGC